MGLGARGAWAALALGVLLVMALLKVAVDGVDSAGSPSSRNAAVQGNSANQTGNPLTQTSSTAKSTTRGPPVSNTETVTTTTTTTKSTTTTPPAVPSTTTVTTSKPGTTPKRTTGAPTTTKPMPKTTSLPKTTSQMSTPTAHASTGTSASSSVTVTTTINSEGRKGSKFDTGSFVGGIVLTMGVLCIFYVGCKMYYSRRGIRYSTIDEHEAII